MNASQQLSDKEIIEGCLKGDRKFQKALYEKFSGKMFSVCVRYAQEISKAEDLMQDGFIKVFKNIEKFRGEGSFEGWIRRIVVNTCIEHFRRNTILYAIGETDVKSYEYYDHNALESLKQEDIMKMVGELSNGYRTVFNLYVVEGYTHREIGEMLNISEGTSKSQLARARYLLQQKIANTSQPVLSEAL